MNPQKIYRSRNPLEVRDSEFQRETGLPEDYRMHPAGGPTMVPSEKSQGRIGSANAISPAKLGPTKYSDTYGMDENLHTQYVDPGFMDKPGSFGH